MKVSLSHDTMRSQCPHCISRFDIPAAALQAADGVVRCGHCMQLFNAIDNAIDEPATGKTDEAIAADAAPESQDATSQPDDHGGASTGSEALHDNDELNPPLPPEPEPEDKAADDVALAEPLFSLEIEMSTLTADENAAHETPFTAPDNFTTSEIDETLEPESLQDPNFDEDNLERIALQQDDPADSPITQELATNDSASDFDFQQFDATPLLPSEVPSGTSQRWRGYRIVASALISLALAATLITQWVLLTPHIQDERLTWLRDSLAPLCAYTHCYHDASAENYQSRGLVVVSHPSEPDALVLKTTLHNTASRSLPFPDLALEFSGLDNQIIASRVFTAREYLGEEFLRQHQQSHPNSGMLLSKNSAVTIELEFIDPGAAAVNYNIRYFPPSKL